MSNDHANAHGELHNYCVCVQHDILSQKLFHNIQGDAMNSYGTSNGVGVTYVHLCSMIHAPVKHGSVKHESGESVGVCNHIDEYIANTTGVSKTSNTTNTANTSKVSSNKVDNVNKNILVVQAVGTNNVVLKLTSQYTLEIELVPINYTNTTNNSPTTNTVLNSSIVPVVKPSSLEYTLYSILQVMLSEWDSELIISNKYSNPSTSQNQNQMFGNEYCSNQVNVSVDTINSHSKHYLVELYKLFSEFCSHALYKNY